MNPSVKARDSSARDLSGASIRRANRVRSAVPIPKDRIVEATLAICLSISVVALALLLSAAGLTIDWRSPDNWPFWAAATLSVVLQIVLARAKTATGRAIAHAGRTYALFTIIALMGATASYPIAALTQGYHDAALQRVDEALHFDWLAWYDVVASHPFLQRAGVAAYQTIYVSPALILGYWAATGQYREAYRFIFLFWLTATVTLALFTMMPAVGPFSYLWHGSAPYMPQSEVWQDQLIPLLRAHREPSIELAHLKGLVSAPSFHAAAAILFIARARTIPLLRWPLMALSGAMLLATPVEGTHYLADIILGIAVAGTAIAFERWCFGPAPVATSGARRSIRGFAVRPA